MPKKQKSSKHTAKKSTSQAEEDNFPLPDFNKMPEVIPEEFVKIIQDFTEDIAITFPEYKPIMDKWWNNKEAALRAEHSEEPERLEMLLKEEKENKTKLVFLHCLHVIPARFFDILYKNETIFEEGSDINTEFLPGIVFKYLWSCDISENTRDTIWKYLQLLLFSIINCVKSKEDFGESAKLFEAIDENELKRKLEETLSSMQDMFNFDEAENSGGEDGAGAGDSQNPFGPGNINMENMPSAENMQEHIQKMMQGKLGKLAMELAEETAEELNLDMDNVGSANDVFKKLFKNPGKLMGVVKNLGSKLDDKIKSGEIKESELISESMEMLNNMKNMPGMNNMHEMFSKMGMPGMGKGKVNVNAMEAQMQKNLKMAQMKERMKKKVSANQTTAAPAPAQTTTPASAPLTDEQLFSVFSKGEKMEKTPRRAKPAPASEKGGSL